MNNDLRVIKKGILLGFGFLAPLMFVGFVSALLADSLNSFSAGDSISSSKMNANFTKIVPIGGMVAWHKDLSGVPSLPDGWVECDGSAISDSESVLNGQTAPNLNGDAGTGNGGRFLRGNSAVTTGTFTDDAFQDHTHRFDNGNSVRILEEGVAGGSDTSAGGRASSIYVNTGNAFDGRTSTETRPSNMSVIWIMRIK